MITEETLERITQSYESRRLNEIMDNEPISDLLRYMLELSVHQFKSQVIACETLVWWKALGSPWVELKDRPKPGELFSGLCEITEQEPLLADKIVQLTFEKGMSVGQQFSEFMVLLLHAKRRLEQSL